MKKLTALVLSGVLAASSITPALASETETPKGNETGVVTEQSISDAQLATMVSNLHALADQALANYNALTAAEKEDLIESNQIDVPAVIAEMKADVTVENLKAYMNQYEDPDAALTKFEEQFVGTIDVINAMIRDSHNYISDDAQYLMEGLGTALKGLQNVFVLHPMIYEDSYVADAKALFTKGSGYVGKITDNVSYELHEEIIKVINEINAFLNTSEENIDLDLVRNSVDAINSFNAYLNEAPEETQNLSFSYGEGQYVYYYQMQQLLVRAFNAYFPSNTVAEGDLIEFYDNYYANMLNAYTEVNKAILKDVDATVKSVASIGYTGAEKAAYEAALKAYNTAFANGDYTELANLAATLKDAANTYVEAANAYVENNREQAIQKLNDAEKALQALQEELTAHPSYYTGAYGTQVYGLLVDIANVDVNTTETKDIVALTAKANEVIAAQKDNYSEAFKDMITEAQSLVTEAKGWWAYLTTGMDELPAYSGAVTLTNNLAAAMTTTNGLYDIDKFQAAYDAFKADLKNPEGSLQSGAYALSKQMLKEATAHYENEVNKEHTAGKLEAMKEALDALSKELENFNYHTSGDAVAKVFNTTMAVLNDKVTPEEPEKPTTPDKKDDTVTKETGAATATAGLLGLSTLLGAAFVARRKEND